MSDLTLRTMIQPLTLWVHEVDKAPDRETLGLWRTDQLFAMLDEFSTATLERVNAEEDAQFIVELVATSDPDVVSLHLRESIVIMAARRISVTAGLDQWEAMAAHFATLIDTAAECYAGPLTAA